LRRGAIVGAEGTGERPFLVRERGHRLLLREGGRGDERGERRQDEAGAHHCFSIGRAGAPPGSGPPPPRPSTGLLTLSGSGNGRSILPRIGRITRKCRK